MLNMRKYLVRKNFDENNVDPLNAPQRTVFYEKEKKSNETISNNDSSDKDKSQTETTELNRKQGSDENVEILNEHAKKIFHESLSALNEYDKKRMDIIYDQLEKEKNLSKELNKKLHSNLSKIASAEVELVKKKNHLEEELHEKTKQLVNSERMAVIGELSGRLAHELRTPLTVIKGTVGVLQLRKGMEIDDFVMERLSLMNESVTRMAQQIERVLAYVQKAPINKKEVALNEIIQNSISMLVKNPNITIHTPKNNAVYNCDPIKIEAMLGNLLLNSVQAIGKESGQISINTDESPDSITIKIQDSGKGVPENLANKIFDPLVSSKMDGTGLGLSSVKNIVEQHNGTISFQNNPTTFTIILPKISK